MTKKILLILSMLMMSSFASPALAAGSESDYASTASKPMGYAAAVKLIKKKDYAAAITKLEAAERYAKKDADIKNLLGFSHRKLGNLDAAGGYYDAALKLDPKHKGALEYQGELFLMLGDVKSAEANLKKLDQICWLGCDEYDDLKKAIADY